VITPIGKLNLSSTLALTPSVKWALEQDFNYCTLWLGFGSEFFMQSGTHYKQILIAFSHFLGVFFLVLDYIF